MKEEIEGQILSKSVEFYELLTHQNIVVVGSVPYNYDDFISDFEFDRFTMFELHKFGSTDKIRQSLDTGLINYCDDLAREFIELEQIK